MDRRVQLNNKLIQVLGSSNVYFQPPADIRMQYPAIVYSLDGANPDRANNSVYRHKKYYQVTYIDRRPDSPVVDRLIEFPHSSLSSHMKVDGLNQYVFRIYH